MPPTKAKEAAHQLINQLPDEVRLGRTGLSDRSACLDRAGGARRCLMQVGSSHRKKSRRAISVLRDDGCLLDAGGNERGWKTSRPISHKDAPSTAKRCGRPALGAARQLTTAPLSGRQVPDYPRQGSRELLERPYRIIYRITTERIEILTVMQSVSCYRAASALQNSGNKKRLRSLGHVGPAFRTFLRVGCASRCAECPWSTGPLLHFPDLTRRI